MFEPDRDLIRRQLVAFACRGVEQFLQDHPGLVFYAFAFDCHAEYAEVNLCLNTEAYFSSSLGEYRAQFPDSCESAMDVQDYRYNTGNWQFQCFDSLQVMTEDELEEIQQSLPDDDFQSWMLFVEDLMGLFRLALRDFCATEVYAAIPKSPDFLAFCIDHDEDVDVALRKSGL